MQFGIRRTADEVAKLIRSEGGIPENGLLLPLLRPLRLKRRSTSYFRPTMDSARSDHKPSAHVEARGLLMVQSTFISMESKYFLNKQSHRTWDVTIFIGNITARNGGVWARA
jgi:hypothetical protein